MDAALLVGVLNGLADLGEDLQPLDEIEFLVSAVLIDGNATRANPRSSR
jgi:hypothetical protein